MNDVETICIEGEDVAVIRGTREVYTSDGRRVDIAWGETEPAMYLGHVAETTQERDARRLREQPGRYELYTTGVVGGIAAVGTFAKCLAAYHGLASRLPSGTTLYIRRRFLGAENEIEVHLATDGTISPTGGQQVRVRRALRTAEECGAAPLALEEIADGARLPYEVTAAALVALVDFGDATGGHGEIYRLTAQGRAMVGIEKRA